MKAKPFVFVSIFFIALAFFTGQVVLAEQDGKTDGADMAALMKQCMDLNTPGAAHRRMDGMVGEWNVVQKYWFGGPGTDAITNQGTSSCKWILNGRFIEETFKCAMVMPDFANPGKMVTTQFEGRGLFGHDNFRNLYTSTWVDNMGTGVFMTQGSFHPKENKYTFYGTMDEPAQKVVGKAVKGVVTIINKDKHVFEMFDLHAGDNYKMMEITYTRK